MLLSKLDTRRVHGSIAMVLVVLSLFVTIVDIVPTNAQGSNNTLPLVAIHVSENTESKWPTLLPAHPHTDWAYFAIYESLEEALRSDGTPFVEVNDSVIESGGLLNSGEPKYPILISLAAECVSDLAASQILQYVSSGGFAYVGSSAWTRYSNGTARSNFALSAEMGVKCDNTTGSSNYWNTLTYIYKNATNRLVDILPTGVNISPWNLPLDNGTSIQNTEAGNAHYFWQARNTATGPADVFLTIPSTPSPYIMLATKAYSNGRFIYQSELTPMIGFSIYAPQMYEYYFFRKAIEWAFESRSLPLARLSAWPYQYDSAFIIRHDCDSGTGFVLGSALREKQLGVTGQYYLMTGMLLDDPSNASLITQLQQAQNLYGAEISSHNGGLNSHYWLGTLPGAYAYYHWGPDICIVKNGTGDYWPYNSTGQSSNPTNLYGKDYANMSIRIALDNLTTWLGQRPVIWVSPWADSSRDDSLEILESQGIESAGERNFGPFPHIALSLNTKGKYYDVIEFPSQPWATSSGAVYQRLEEHSYGTGGTMQQMIDFLYSMGAMVNMYGHVSSSGGVGEAYINYSKSKPNMWNATPTLIRDWWLQRNPVSINPVYQLLPDGTRNLTITVTGSTSPDTTVEIAFPVSSMNEIYGLQVFLDGAPTTNYRTPGTGAKALKVKAGLASKITVTYKQLTLWTQTSQADFESGTLTNLDTSSVPGQVSLAPQSGGSTLFCDYFNDSSWTSSQWTVHSGNWDTGVYIQSDASASYKFSYAGNTSWTDYSVEAVAGTSPTSGQYFAQIGARLNPVTGTHYSLWLYPSTGGPNVAKLLKFSNWATWTLVGTQATVTTDTGWHTLKMVLNGSAISCYYDGKSIINATDSTYTSGLVDFECYATYAKYDSVTVKNLAGDTVLFSDDFNNASWTSSKWTVNGGTWNVEVEKYLQSDQTGSGAAGYKNSYAGDTAWTDYVVEARGRYYVGSYWAQIAARLNPTTGTRYAYWVYPASGQGPNTVRLLKFTDWSTWTQLAQATVATDTNWHTLKMELNGASINCYYDGALAMQVTDSSYSSGAIDVETYASSVEYDWITVKQPSVYYTSGTLVSSPFDTGFKAQWMNISWTAYTPSGTQIKFRTRTAPTQGDLASGTWSDYYTVSGTAITSPANRWIQYEVSLSTSNTSVTPKLYDVTVSYMEMINHSLTIVASGHGTTDPAPGAYSISEGEQQIVTALPDSGYKLDYWDLDSVNVGSSPSYTVTMDTDHTLTAVFVPKPRIFIDPSLTEKASGDVYGTFEVDVTIEDIQDLWGFDFNVTWDSGLLTLASVDFNTTLDNMWGYEHWLVAYEATGPGYYELVAVSTLAGYSGTLPTPLATLEFYIENVAGETPIHLALVKLSNSTWQPIDARQTDGTYRFTGPVYRPSIDVAPATVTCRKYLESFDVQINVTNALRVQGFNFELHYNASLINYVSVTWGNLGTGTITIVDNQNGVLAGNVAGPTLSQNLWLLNITFKVNQTMIWHAGATNRLDGEIWFHDVILYFSGGSQLQREEGGINQIDTQTASYSFMPIQGDVDNDGTVNVFDLRTVAAHYDVTSSDPEWAVASKFDLNGDLTIDIYDLVVVGANFGFAC